jgi:hypothetical protein
MQQKDSVVAKVMEDVSHGQVILLVAARGRSLVNVDAGPLIAIHSRSRALLQRLNNRIGSQVGREK